MSKSSFEVQLEDYFNTWLVEKKRAEETGDYKEYEWFLKETKKEFNKLYAKMTHEKWIEPMGKILELLSCEIKKIHIKYKESNETR